MPDIFDQLVEEEPQRQPQQAPRGDVFDQLAAEEPVTRRVPEGFQRVLDQGGVSQEDRARLLRTGITPGTAPEFAAAHVQARKAERGEPLSTREQVAIMDLYKGLAGREDVAGAPDYFAEQRQQEAATRGETVLGQIENFRLNVASGMAAAPTNIIGLASPETAAELREKQQLRYNPGGGRSGFLGQTLAEGANVAGALALGPYGMAALYGGRGAGGARTDIEQQRQMGREISGATEAKAAAGTGVIEGVSGLVGGKLFRGIGNAMSRMGKEAVTHTGIRKAIGEGARVAGLTGTEAIEEAATELAVNKMKQVTYEPEQAVTEGVLEAFVMGGLLAPIGGGVMSAAQGGGVSGDAHTLDQRLRARIQRRMEGQRRGEEAIDPDVQQDELITDPARLLPAPPTAEEQLADIDAEAEAQRQALEQQATSGQTIVVDQQGRVMSPEQAAALEQAGTEFAKQQGFAARPTFSRSQVADDAAQQDPDVQQDPGQAEVTRAYFEGELNNLRHGDEEFVEIDVPVEMVETRPGGRPDAAEQYAEQGPTTAPPIVGGTTQEGGPITVVDGNNRVVAAKRRGDTTIRARVPRSDVRELGLDRAAPTRALPAPVDFTAGSRAQLLQDEVAKAGSIRGAARNLGIPESTLRRQMKEAKVDPQAVRQARERVPEGERRVEAPVARREVDALIEAGDMDAARRRISELQAELRTDPLTGEGNRRRLDEVGEALEARANRRGSGQPVVYLDVDNLHTGNEVFGHESMDARMRAFTRVMREEAGSTATITRQGGDEFAIAWEGGKSQREARRIAEKIKKRVGRERAAPGVTVGLSTGVGIVKPNGSFTDALNQAERQATESKKKTKATRGERTTREAAKEAATTPPPPAPEGLDLATTKNAEAKRRAALKNIQRQRRLKRRKVLQQEAQRQADALASEYKQQFQRGTKDPGKVEQIKPETAQRIANVYENLEHNPGDAEVQESYAAFKQETLDQFEMLRRQGYTFTLEDVQTVAKEYPDTASIARDLGQNKHLYVNADPGDMPTDHPLMEQAPGTGMTYNQVFRAVHDIFGHARAGNELDILGEENAWRSHASMYSEKARGALATETRAQSNWVGYGPHGPQNQRAIKEDRIGDVVFPNQKAALLPDTFWSVPGMTPLHTPRPALSVTEGMQARKTAKQTKKGIVGSKTVRDAKQTVEDIVASLAPRIRDISPTIYRRVKQMMYDAGVGEERALSQFEQAMKPVHAEIRNWNTDLGRRVAATLMSDREAAKELLSDEAGRAIDEAGQLLDTLQQRLIDAGVPVNTVKNFWPRVVRDLDALQEYLGDTERGEIDRALVAARRGKGRDLTHEEKVAIINQHFRGRGPVDPGKVGPRHTRARSIETVTQQMLDMYQNPTQAAVSYIRDMNKSVERAKFFGRKEVTMENLGDSVGVFVADAVARGEVDPKQQEEVVHLIRALTVGDMARSGSGTRTLKQIAYFSYLTNFKSALTQIADAAGNAYLNGPSALIRGYGDALLGKKNARRMTMEELGLHDYGAEWDDVGKMATILDRMLRVHGFKRLDRLGKEAFINSTKHRLKDAAANPRGRKAKGFEQRYGDVFSREEWEQIWRDVRQGNTTEQVRFLTFLHLSNIQPLDVSETPVGYANNSNIFGNTAIQSRLLYSLKTFTMKRLDFIRRETVGEWRKGNKATAARNMAALWLLWSAYEIPIDLLKDFLRGKLRWQDLPDTAVDAMLGLVMMNRYALDEVKEDPIAGVTHWFTSAIGGGILTDAWADAYEGATGEAHRGPWKATPGLRLIRHAPIVGDSLYYLTPIGEGYHITNSQDEQRGRENMQRVREQAMTAVRQGNTFEARTLLNMYNDNKQITGRKTNLTLRDLRKELNRERSNPLD